MHSRTSDRQKPAAIPIYRVWWILKVKRDDAVTNADGGSLITADDKMVTARHLFYISVFLQGLSARPLGSRLAKRDPAPRPEGSAASSRSDERRQAQAQASFVRSETHFARLASGALDAQSAASARRGRPLAGCRAPNRLILTPRSLQCVGGDFTSKMGVLLCIDLLNP